MRCGSGEFFFLLSRCGAAAVSFFFLLSRCGAAAVELLEKNFFFRKTSIMLETITLLCFRLERIFSLHIFDLMVYLKTNVNIELL